MKAPVSQILRIFVTGLLAALPLAATVAIFAWAANLLLRWLGPESLIGSLLVAIGLGVTGSEVVGYLIGIAVVAVAIFGLGALVEAGLQRGMSRAFNALLRRIPLVRTVYDLIRRMVALLSQREGDDPSGLKSMRAVWCHFGGPGGAAALALLSNPDPIWFGDQAYVAVLVPTAPVPVGGGLLWVPRDWVTPADVGVEAVTSIYVSMGVTSSQYLQPKMAFAPPDPEKRPVAM